MSIKTSIFTPINYTLHVFIKQFYNISKYQTPAYQLLIYQLLLSTHESSAWKSFANFSLRHQFPPLSLYNSPPYASATAGKNTSGLQSSYLTPYTTPSSMTQYSSYATYNSGTTNFPNVAQNISSSSQVLKYFVK